MTNRPQGWDFGAEGFKEDERCPQCASTDTVTYRYPEGFSELECRSCGFSTEAEAIGELTRYLGELREGRGRRPPVPLKKLEA
jgi:Zn ribbon nucleic-acid-binding protein